jgi:hypothetical protein
VDVVDVAAAVAVSAEHGLNNRRRSRDCKLILHYFTFVKVEGLGKGNGNGNCNS